MACRERIDPGATQSVYDEKYGNKRVLRLLFDPLVEQKIIYGGMFTGAMGGGCAMLCLTQYGKIHLNTVLNELKKWTINGLQPFRDLKIIPYSINTCGIKLILRESDIKKCSDSQLVCYKVEEV